MLVFKKGVLGIVHDGEFGEIVEVINEPLTEREIYLMNKVMSECFTLLLTNEDLNDYFWIESKEEFENSYKEFVEVFEFID